MKLWAEFAAADPRAARDSESRGTLRHARRAGTLRQCATGTACANACAALLAAVLLCAAAPPGLAGIVLDRIAATVGKHVITESEVIEEIRIAAFLNCQSPDFSPASRRDAAGRLVDQELLREQMQLTGFPVPPDGAAKLLDEITRRYPNEAEFERALARDGITLDQLKSHLAWQIAVLKFTDYLFRPNIPGPQNAKSAAAASNIDQQLDAWLKQARSQAQIRFFKEAFQ
jgi:hypothetical protein